MRIERDFEELLGFFNKNGVRYCIVGAFAVGFYGYPRYTKDIDIFVEPSIENGNKIVKALDDFGFGELKLSPEDFARKGAIIQLGCEPVRADLINSIKGCTFQRAWKNKQVGQYGKEKVFFIGLGELVKSKQATGRRQDKVDIQTLSARQKFSRK
ncbi:MAG: hypothetical protein FJZ13_06260 [Candidatus Omnitrophica bacterium]|nr:hypothetical protein [Candidatus Omnitrophota bacterium]